MSNINNDINSQTTSTWRMLLDETIFTNRKFYIQVAAICAAVIIFVALCNIPNMLAFAKMYFTHKYNFTYVDNMSGVFGFIAVTYFATCSAFIVSNIQDKRSRIAEFMIPASKLEKFVVRYIHLVVFIPLAALVGIAVGDVLQVILGLVITGDCQSFIVTMFRNFGFTSDSPADTFLLVALFVFFHTLLLVLGTIIRRRAWIKSNIIVWFSLFVLTMAGLCIAYLVLNAIYGNVNYAITTLTDRDVLDVFLSIIIIAVSVFNYRLSFRIYSIMQIVTNRWHNL